MEKKPEIFCPECAYRPHPRDRWSCVPSCGTTWHTFATRGVCPGCNTRWLVTQCPACAEITPHEDWYHYPPDLEVDDRVSETVGGGRRR